MYVLTLRSFVNLIYNKMYVHLTAVWQEAEPSIANEACACMYTCDACSKHELQDALTNLLRGPHDVS